MDPRTHWRSPSFGGCRSPHPRQPRYRGGGGGGFGSPRHFSPQWQHRSPSPYRYQNQQSPYSPQLRSPYEPHSFTTSTPAHSSGRRPFFRGGGRFNKRQSFGSSMNQSSSADDIDNWISPEMWSDPWRYLTTSQSCRDEMMSTTSLATSGKEMEAGTKFAESDFDITDNVSASTTNPAYGESSTTSVKESIMDNNEGQKPAELAGKIDSDSSSKSKNSDILPT